MKYSILFSLICGGLSFISAANEPIELSQELAVIQDAKPIKRVPPKYPVNQARNGVDGWVKLSFIVEPDGKTSNAIVESSSGISAFEREALKAVEKWQYDPAMENGKAIQQCYNSVRMEFSMGRNKPTVSKKFYRLYDKLASALDAKEAKDIEDYAERVAKYKIKTLEESQYKYTILADYAEYVGDKEQQLSYLDAAASFSGASDYFKYKRGLESVASVGLEVDSKSSREEQLSAVKKRKYAHIDKVLFPILHKKLVIELEFGQVSEALRTVNGLLLLDSASNNQAAYSKQKAFLKEIIDGDRPIVTSANIEENQFWHYRLLRNTFQLTDINGRLTKLDVRCRNKRHVYTVDDRSVWQLPETWQGCGVYIYGEDNTQFKLVELPSVLANQEASDSQTASE